MRLCRRQAQKLKSTQPLEDAATAAEAVATAAASFAASTGSSAKKPTPNGTLQARWDKKKEGNVLLTGAYATAGFDVNKVPGA